MPVFILDKKQKVSKDGKVISVGFRELTDRSYRKLVLELDSVKKRIAKMDAAVLQNSKSELRQAINDVNNYCDHPSTK